MRLLHLLLVFVVLVTGIAALQRFSWITDLQATNLFVALVPLLGVLLTLNWSQRQFERNLSEEREKTENARRLNAKQAAFIEAAEAVLSFVTYVASLPDTDLPKGGETPKEVQRFPLALTKLNFFSDLPTIEGCIRLNRMLMECFIDVLQAKLPSVFITEDIKIVDSQIGSLEKQVQQISDEMLAVIKIDPSHGLLPIQRQAMANTHQQLADIQGRKAQLLQKKYQESEQCRDVVLSRLRETYPAMIDILLAARRELNFPIEEQRYKVLMNEETAAMLRKMDAMITALRQQVASKIAG